jgi:cytochrome c oxidase cbb3-type subunit 3
MSAKTGNHSFTAAILVATGLGFATPASGQGAESNPGWPNELGAPGAGESALQKLMQTPWTAIIPGALPVGKEEMKNPEENVEGSAERGLHYFVGMNCVGCHGPNAGGAMGPQLSNDKLFRFGPHPAQHYLVISHGAPTGMPAWGTVLPNVVVWDIVSYIQTLSQMPSHEWGETTNPAINEPATEQVPYEFSQTTDPWQHTLPFRPGKKPTDHPPATSWNVTDLAW